VVSQEQKIMVEELSMTSHPQPAIKVENLKKTFKVGFRRKVVEAVRGVSFEVQPGEIFGFLGPNGAGKTTTMKMMMGLIKPSDGQISLFGLPAAKSSTRAKVGFLPEQPYFYDYLTPLELLRFMGKLSHVPEPGLTKQANELIDQIGLGHARDRTLRKFSKGMLQRLGIAQTLIGDPSLIVLDEPLSGLDPIGRKEIKDIISQAKTDGRTVFFSSHILSDIELLCDRVAIIKDGKILKNGVTSELLAESTSQVEIVVQADNSDVKELISKLQVETEQLGAVIRITADSSEGPTLVTKLVHAGAQVNSVIPRSASLESVFIKLASDNR
jgi:ABC-2 type transport system ATP-binding protein